jgi:hypothetical protein
MRIPKTNKSKIGFCYFIFNVGEYSSMLMSQKKSKEEKIHMHSLDLSHAHFEFVGLMLMSSNAL